MWPVVYHSDRDPPRADRTRKVGGCSVFRGWKADILIDCRLLAYRRGGIARYAAELTRWLPVVAPDLCIVPFANRPTRGMSTDVLRVFTPPHHRLERWALGSELSLRRPRLVHSVDFISPLTVGTRRVVTVHDLAFLEEPESITGESQHYYGQIERSITSADRVICVSAFTAQAVLRQFSIAPHTVVTIWNGADSNKITLSLGQSRTIIHEKLGAEKSQRVCTDRPLLLVVGTIEPRKRHGLLLDAMRQIAEATQQPRPLLVIVGQRGWNCGEIIEKINQAEERGDVIWIESVDDQLLASLYRAATIHLLASRDEGFGLPVLEAMHAGLPVIAAARGALPEIVGDAALLVASDDPTDWAVAISRLLDDQYEQELLRQRGRVRAAEFTWEQTARRTADVYREVLGR